MYNLPPHSDMLQKHSIVRHLPFFLLCYITVILSLLLLNVHDYIVEYVIQLYSLLKATSNRKEGDTLFRGDRYHHLGRYGCSLYDVLSS